jgi:hypothetical protein
MSSGLEWCEDPVSLHRHVAIMMVSQTHLGEARTNSKGDWGIEKPRNKNDTLDFTYKTSFRVHCLHTL